MILLDRWKNEGINKVGYIFKEKDRQYTIITENDESEWDDKTGEKYHFPSRYVNIYNQELKSFITKEA